MNQLGIFWDLVILFFLCVLFSCCWVGFFVFWLLFLFLVMNWFFQFSLMVKCCMCFSYIVFIVFRVMVKMNSLIMILVGMVMKKICNCGISCESMFSVRQKIRLQMISGVVSWIVMWKVLINVFSVYCLVFVIDGMLFGGNNLQELCVVINNRWCNLVVNRSVMNIRFRKVDMMVFWVFMDGLKFCVMVRLFCMLII